MNAGLPRFVAATDFSEHAGWAAQRAALLAAQHGAKLELLHVVPKTPLDALRELFRAKPEGVRNLVEDLRRALTRAASALAKATGASIAPRVEIGEVLDVIASECNGADLLAMGARGTSPLRDALLGTTAERLLGKCKRPMLIAKRAAKRPYKDVLVAVDFSPASEDALRAVLRLMPQAAVTAVHAYDIPFEGQLRLAGVEKATIEGYRSRAAAKAVAEIRALGSKISGDGMRVGHRIGMGHPPHLILEKAQALHADLIVLGKQKRAIVQQLLLGSVARHVLADSRSDVLVVPAA